MSTAVYCSRCRIGRLDDEGICPLCGSVGPHVGRRKRWAFALGQVLGNLNTGLVAIGLLLSTVYLAMVIPSCGAATGDIEGQVLAMPSTSEPPVRLAGATVFIAGSEIDCGRRSDNCVTRTDSSGQYRFDDVPVGDYGLSFVHDDPTFASDTALASQGREVNVSQGNVETVSVVLLPEGVQAPPVPADLERRVRDSGGFATGYGGIMNNPFFWLWMFDRPWVFGYPRPPVVTTRSERFHARSSVPTTRPRLSPTTLVWFRSMPRAGSCCAIQALFVSTISPSRISVPIATISAFTRASLAARPERGGWMDLHEDAERVPASPDQLLNLLRERNVLQDHAIARADELDPDHCALCRVVDDAQVVEKRLTSGGLVVQETHIEDVGFGVVGRLGHASPPRPRW